MEITKERREQILIVNDYIEEDTQNANNIVIESLEHILSIEDPDARDIIIGVALKKPEKFWKLLKELPDESHSDLNIINIKIILASYKGWETEPYIEEARKLIFDGIPGTTLFDLLKTDLERDEQEPENITICGLIINAESLAEENKFHIF